MRISVIFLTSIFTITMLIDQMTIYKKQSMTRHMLIVNDVIYNLVKNIFVIFVLWGSSRRYIRNEIVFYLLQQFFIIIHWNRFMLLLWIYLHFITSYQLSADIARRTRSCSRCSCWMFNQRNPNITYKNVLFLFYEVTVHKWDAIPHRFVAFRVYLI